MTEFLKVIGVFVLVMFVLVGIPLLAINAHAANLCARHQMITGNETQYSNFDACYVKHNGEWMRYSAYEKIIVARDGLAAEAAD